MPFQVAGKSSVDLAARSRRADRPLPSHLAEDNATVRTLDRLRRHQHELIRLDLVATRGTRYREVEVRLSLEPRCHEARSFAVHTGLRTIRK
jgi:hypothetical protein